jgi:hypothetical protein
LAGAVVSPLICGESSEPVPNALFHLPRSQTLDVTAAHETNEGLQFFESRNSQPFVLLRIGRSRLRAALDFTFGGGREIGPHT